jgi:hypothetical protein
MRKLIVLEYITLDGVIQAAGGSKEDAAQDSSTEAGKGLTLMNSWET